MSPKILMSDDRKPEAADGARRPVPTWGVVGWLGVVLTVVALGDFALAFIPPHFGSPEWEFGTVASVFSGLPLLTMGLAALWLSVNQRGARWQTLAVAVLLVLLGVVLIGLLVLFLLDVPMALRASEGPVRLGVLKATAKTVLLGMVFALTYVASGVLSLMWRSRSGRGER